MTSVNIELFILLHIINEIEFNNDYEFLMTFQFNLIFSLINEEMYKYL